MEHERFDSWVRTLTTARTRRRALLGLVGGGVGLFSLTETEAKHHQKHKKKKGGGGGSPPVSPPPVSPPPPPFICPSQRVCGATCCPEGQVCGSNGACVDPSCCSGSASCGGRTTEGTSCCVVPSQARCCCPSSPGADDGFVECCTGAACNASCPNGGGVTIGGISGSQNPDGTCGHGGNAEGVCIF